MLPHTVIQPRAMLFHAGSVACRSSFPEMVASAERCAAVCRGNHQPRLARAFERDAAFMRAFLAGEAA